MNVEVRRMEYKGPERRARVGLPPAYWRKLEAGEPLLPNPLLEELTWHEVNPPINANEVAGRAAEVFANWNNGGWRNGHADPLGWDETLKDVYDAAARDGLAAFNSLRGQQQAFIVDMSQRFNSNPIPPNFGLSGLPVARKARQRMMVEDFFARQTEAMLR